MSESSPYKSFDKLFSDLIRRNDLKSSKTLKRFAILHNSDQEILEATAKNEKDPELRMLAVQKLTNQELLFEIAQYDEVKNIQREAISKINDKKKLTILRLVSSSSLQNEIFERIRVIER